MRVPIPIMTRHSSPYIRLTACILSTLGLALTPLCAAAGMQVPGRPLVRPPTTAVPKKPVTPSRDPAMSALLLRVLSRYASAAPDANDVDRTAARLLGSTAASRATAQRILQQFAATPEAARRTFLATLPTSITNTIVLPAELTQQATRLRLGANATAGAATRLPGSVTSGGVKTQPVGVYLAGLHSLEGVWYPTPVVVTLVTFAAGDPQVRSTAFPEDASLPLVTYDSWVLGSGQPLGTIDAGDTVVVVSRVPGNATAPNAAAIAAKRAETEMVVRLGASLVLSMGAADKAQALEDLLLFGQFLASADSPSDWANSMQTWSFSQQQMYDLGVGPRSTAGPFEVDYHQCVSFTGTGGRTAEDVYLRLRTGAGLTVPTRRPPNVLTVRVSRVRALDAANAGDAAPAAAGGQSGPLGALGDALGGMQDAFNATRAEQRNTTNGFVGMIGIGGVAGGMTNYADGDDVSPNWECSVTLPPAPGLADPISVQVELLRYLSGRDFPVHYDTSPAANRTTLELSYNRATGRITGDATGARGQALTIVGAGSLPRANITVTIDHR